MSRRGLLPLLVPGPYVVRVVLAGEPLVAIRRSAPVRVPFGTRCMCCARLSLVARQRTFVSELGVIPISTV